MSASPRDFVQARERMVTEQIVRRGVQDSLVIEAMRSVLRHVFVPVSLADEAYADHPLPIGHGQTISQPYIVAVMTELVALQPGARVLEVGTGSGYQAAILAEIADSVYTIEVIPELAEHAVGTLTRLGVRNVKVRTGDGYQGWPDAAPFDAIVVTAAPDHIPQPLVDQLVIGGRMVLPVGREEQNLIVVTRTSEGASARHEIPVLFVPMTGQAQR
jgi:protein-L-isoaspartate(D-aspartate) O-methyltransferase